MADLHNLHSAGSYLNPVYASSCPDPFVLKYCGEYWAYCTGFWPDGRCFGILRSRDLVNWQEVGSAMDPLPGEHTHYWAPEVTYHNGRFLLYYSVGNEEFMQMRVAVASHPAGPFVDSGRRLTNEQFAIDGHVFVDDDGSWHFFYATDFLQHTHIGTGTVRDRMLDPFTPAGQPRPVTRARYDWQVYDPQRAEKGGVRWHTVEGSFVLKRKGLYYHMFSGGNWQNITYGVSYALTDDIETPEEWEQIADGEQVLPILRTLPGQVIGPGHNSVVRGPDNRQLFCIYHRWVAGARAMAIDPLDWAGERMLVLGPSTEPRPAPLSPTFADFFDQDRDDGLGVGWACERGHWIVRGGAALHHADDLGVARYAAPAGSFVAEVSLRATDDTPDAFGVGLYGGQEPLLQVWLAPSRGQASLAWQSDSGWSEQQFALPEDFNPRAYHLLRLEADGPRVRVALDDYVARWHVTLTGQAESVALQAKGRAAFTGFALTTGWQDLFTEQGIHPAELGWHAEGPQQSWRIANGELWPPADQTGAAIFKGPLLERYELVVNIGFARQDGARGGCGVYPAARPGQPGPLCSVEPGPAGWALVCSDGSSQHILTLPGDFDPVHHQQFRFHKQNGRLSIQWESHALGEIDAPLEATRIGLYARHAAATFEMVRLTALP